VDQSDGRVIFQNIQNVLIAPIPDPVDNAYFDALNQQILVYLQNHKSRGIVFDMSGVEVLDADDFERFFKLYKSTQLMGAQLIFSGIKPGVAAALVMLNVEDGWLDSAISVEQAIRKIQ
jgi:rsbT antagonist protein RsbS